MNYENQILNYMQIHSDTITVDEVNALNIPRVILNRLINKNLIEKIKTGLYVLKDSWGDEYFNLIYKNKYAVYSHLTSLYFHDLCERVPLIYDITVKQNYGGNLIKNNEITSPQGRTIKCYDIERSLCDLIKCKNKIYLEYLKYAFNEYYKIQKNNPQKLYEYAKKLNIYPKVKEFMEVFL